ncbi:MAG TPA: OsmC family protein [Hyphomonadaceae bacterium]|jgi:organic hydroperoxide reductase OsmC/OhrA|nr:OsmC family protein [Hyphomonadaceae bacterium]HPN06230.1 OsmC family protein [Hyphomonadaceae bacterium]
MRSTTVELRTIAGTEAVLGWANGHTVVVDRPEGAAGGQGLGFNGSQLLSLALGGCFCNDLRYTAETMGVKIGAIAVTVKLDMDGAPLLSQAAAMTVHVEMLDGSDPTALIEASKKKCMVSNSLRRGFPVEIAQV